MEEEEKWYGAASGCKLPENLNKHPPWIASAEQSASLWTFFLYPTTSIDFPPSVKIAFIFYCLPARTSCLRMLHCVDFNKNIRYVLMLLALYYEI